MTATTSETHDIVVIGAGLAGTLTAIELAKAGYKVLLLESGETILPLNSSSFNECYKLHVGMHYFGDLKTATQCLQNSIQFARAFPNCIEGGDNLSAPWRRGRHFIMSNSQYTVEQAQSVADQLKASYEQLIQEDKNNQVFGPPEQFITQLDPTQYQSLFAEQIPFYPPNGKRENVSITLGIETGESQINIQQLKTELISMIAKYPTLIAFQPNTTITHITYDQKTATFILNIQKQNPICAKVVVNCTWQNIEKIAPDLHFPSHDHDVIRMKAIILVELPEALKNMHTCIFSIGPYCSITVLSDGTAILASERTTNIAFYYSDQPIPNDIKRLQQTLTLDHPEGKNLAQRILSECSEYFSPPYKSALEQAPIKALRVGYVRVPDPKNTYNHHTLYDKKSIIHHRYQETGIQTYNIPYFSNAAMKMTYALSNACQLANLLIEKYAYIIKLSQSKSQTSPDTHYILKEESDSETHTANSACSSCHNTPPPQSSMLPSLNMKEILLFLDTLRVKIMMSMRKLMHFLKTVFRKISNPDHQDKVNIQLDNTYTDTNHLNNPNAKSRHSPGCHPEPCNGEGSPIIENRLNKGDPSSGEAGRGMTWGVTQSQIIDSIDIPSLKNTQFDKLFVCESESQASSSADCLTKDNY